MKRILGFGGLAWALMVVPAIAGPPAPSSGEVGAQAFTETIGTPRDPAAHIVEMQAQGKTLASAGSQQALGRPLTIQLSEDERSRIDASRDLAAGKYRVGIARRVGAAIDFSAVRSLGDRSQDLTLGVAQGTGDGGYVWTAVIEAPGATALRLHLTGVDLPAGARLYVYNLAGQAFGPYTGRGPLGDGVLHTNTVFGEELLLQLHVPAEAPTPRLTVAEAGVLGSRFAAPRPAGCGVDAAFPSSPATNAAREAVASLLFESGDALYLCTGALVADTDPTSVIPYLLTAHRCISRRDEAASLETYFDDRRPCSGSRCTEPANPNGDTLGATLEAADPASDFTLLRLAATPVTADGVTTYLGWTSSPVGGLDDLALYRVSHPSLDEACDSASNATADETFAAGYPALARPWR
jgi:hypothetical protein